jgi:hypothetical protein
MAKAQRGKIRRQQAIGGK